MTCKEYPYFHPPTKGFDFDGMMKAIAGHATVRSIAPTPQPDFAAELLKLGERFAQRFGAGNLPSGWDEPHVDFPPWVATSIDYEPSPAAREAMDPGMPFSRGSAPTPGWPVGILRLCTRADPQALPRVRT